MISYHFISYESVDSTNNEIKRLYHQGACEGTVVMAKTQTAGKGRLGRQWISPSGNLYFTVLLNPLVPLDILSQLSLVAGLSLAKIMHYYVNQERRVALKWPNDVMIDGQKVAGILIETDTEGDLSVGKKIPCYLGIGVNITSSPNLGIYPTIALKEIMLFPPTPLEFLEGFIKEFNSLYRRWLESGFRSLREEWLSFAYGLGEIGVVTSGKKGQLRGKFMTISDTGSICLLDQAGKRHSITSSEVTFIFNND